MAVSETFSVLLLIILFVYVPDIAPVLIHLPLFLIQFYLLASKRVLPLTLVSLFPGASILSRFTLI